MGLFVWVENSRIIAQKHYFEPKLKAAELMQQAEDIIRSYQDERGFYIDTENDPNETALIGEKETLITTDRGSLRSKLTTLNPNFAAIILQYFKDSGLTEGDKIAVSVTGSMPALNIAVLSAAKVLGLQVEMITSVGASMFGATDPDFTWLDMESLLRKEGLFEHKSIAASMGGGRDLGRGLNRIGRELILQAIKRNEVPLVKENSLEANINQKMLIWQQAAAGEPYKMYINVGGGLSSLGNSINGKLLQPGYHKYLNIKNIPLKGTMFLFAEKTVPVLHLLDITKLADMHNLPVSPVPLPQPGQGEVFESPKYNVNIAIIALAVMVILIIIIIIFDKKQLKFKEDELAL
jgi:poly-gamma-glutamate system protein